MERELLLGAAMPRPNMLLALPFVIASFAGCGPQDEPRGPSAAPPLVFEQQSASKLTTSGIATDAPMLMGTMFLLSATNSAVGSEWEAESSNEQVVTIEETYVLCSCKNGLSARAIAVTEGCRREETRSCSVSIFGKAHGPGEALVDVLDRERGSLVQQLPVRVAKAASLQALVYVAETDAGAPAMQSGPGLTASADATYDVPIGHAVHVSYIARDESGAELHSLFGGVAIARPDGDAFAIENQSAGVLHMRAARDGTSTVAIATDEGAVDAAIVAPSIRTIATLRAVR